MNLREKEENQKYRNWIISTLVLTLAVFILFASITIYIDPLFHYHAPLKNYAYPINNERYQNDGITRNFEYDSIITGTSMTENFMKTEADEIFHANFIKIPYNGAFFNEINDRLERAYDNERNVKFIIRGIDYDMLAADKNATRDFDYPTYLYNDNIFDDVNYVLNKSILLGQTWDVIRYSRGGENETTSFDEYVNWHAPKSEFGRDAVLVTYTLNEKAEEQKILSDEERISILENIRQNVTDLADEHPETTFYYFFTPYSICYWDKKNNDGKLNAQLDTERVVIEEILKHPNIKLYSFFNNFELICNLDNYKDFLHYGEWVNSWILEWMWNDEYLLTSDNYMEYVETIQEFYNSYDYESLRSMEDK